MRILSLLAAAAVLSATWVLAQTPSVPKKPAAPAKAPTGSQPAAKPTADKNGGDKNGGDKPAADKPAPGPKDEVRKASQTYLAALNAGDFKAAAALWAADGQFTDSSGRSTPGRTLVSEVLPKKYADGKRPQLSVDLKSIQLITPDIAQEEGNVQATAADGTAHPRGKFNALWVKQQNKWLLKALRQMSDTGMDHTYPLTDLEWLVGHWAAENDGDDIYIDVHWTPNRVYIMRDITVMRDGLVRHSVTQRIGLDPLSPNLKSWSFDSDGGLAEAYWEKMGDRWVVATRGASANGTITSAHNFYSDIKPDSFTVDSSDARLGNTAVNGLKLKFTRDTSMEKSVASVDSPLTANPPPSGGNGGSPNGGNTPGTRNPPPNGNPPTQPSPGVDSMAKEQILNSAEWRQTQQAYNEWLSIQKIYTPEEVQELKAETRAKIAKMTAPQLQNFLDDANEKVKILLSKQAEDARLWLAQRMAVEVKLSPEDLKLQRSDIANMTAAQVEQRLLEIEQRRKQTEQAQTAFDNDRQFRIKAMNEQAKQDNQDREAALNRAAEDMSGYGGYYGGGWGGPPGGVRGGWGGGYRGYYGGYRW